MNQLFPLALATLCLTAPASAQIASFQHFIVGGGLCGSGEANGMVKVNHCGHEEA